MKYGKLFYDNEIDRINVSWGNGVYGDGFHCGDVVETYIPATGLWGYQRIEYDHSAKEWYFDNYGSIPVGAEIRIQGE